MNRIYTIARSYYWIANFCSRNALLLTDFTKLRATILTEDVPVLLKVKKGNLREYAEFPRHNRQAVTIYSQKSLGWRITMNQGWIL
jgi:hypothetical protein